MCFFPSASGDADHYVVRFYRHFSSEICDPSHISLFRRDCGPGSVREHLLKQDLIYVGGGSILSLLGVWRAHGIDEDLRAAWQAGVILCGVSAGSLCWFASGLTAYHHDAKPYEGLGFLPHSNAVHYEEESNRRPAYHAALLDGQLPGGYGASDGAALHFVGEDLHRVVLSRPRRARTGSRPSATRSWSSRWRRPISAIGRRSPLPPPKKRPPTILAMGGGGFTMEPENPALDDYVLSLADAPMPKICLLPTASGDGEAQIRQFHATFGSRACEPMHISLFRLGSRPVPLRETLLEQDVIYVGGGSMLGLLAVWRALGLDAILRECWEAGVVLAGLSAGAMCWFEWGITSSLGSPAPSPGLGFLPGSMSVHCRRRAGAAAGLPRGDRRRHDPARLRRRRRRRAALPRHRARGGRQLAPRPPRAARRPGRRDASSSRACWPSPTASARRPRSPSSAACARSARPPRVAKARCAQAARAVALKAQSICLERWKFTPSASSSGPWAASRARKSSQSRAG